MRARHQRGQHPCPLLDYSSWTFQAIFLVIVLYPVVGQLKPAWVGGASRRTIAIVSVAGLLIASTVFYIAVRPLNGPPDGPLPPQGAAATTPQP